MSCYRMILLKIPFKKRLLSLKVLWLTIRANNQYRIETLPKEIQFTCVNVILTTDLNGDNYKDIILGENNFSFKPQFGRLDAGFAHLLMGSDSGFMKPELIGTSGQGVVKSIKEITIKNQKYIILGINDERSKLYKVNK